MTPMKNLFHRIATWLQSLFKGKGKRLFVVAWKAATDTALDRLNDPDLQQAALACVRAAAAKALHGDDAWNEAWASFRAHALAAGKDWGRSTLETILQVTYSRFKDSLLPAENSTTVSTLP